MMMSKRQLIQTIKADIRMMTGREYRIDLEALSEFSLREVIRLLRDFEYAKRAAEQRARRMPWR